MKGTTLADWSMVVLILVYVIATIAIVVVNLRTIKEMKTTREEENRPYVVAYLDWDSNMTSVNLIIENVGKSMARNVKLFVDQEIPFPDQLSPITDAYIFKSGIPNLPPRHKMTAWLGTAFNFKNEDGSSPCYQVNISYTFQEGMKIKQRNEEYVLDGRVFENVHRIRTKNIHNVAEELKKIRSYTKKGLQKNRQVIEVITLLDQWLRRELGPLETDEGEKG